MRLPQLRLASLFRRRHYFCRATLTRWQSQKTDVARESLVFREKMTQLKPQTNHCAIRPVKQVEKLVEIAHQMHHVQLVDGAHLLDLFRSQCDLHGEVNSLEVA